MASALFSERRIASMNVELFSALFDESRFDATSSFGFSPHESQFWSQTEKIRGKLNHRIGE